MTGDSGTERRTTDRSRRQWQYALVAALILIGCVPVLVAGASADSAAAQSTIADGRPTAIDADDISVSFTGTRTTVRPNRPARLTLGITNPATNDQAVRATLTITPPTGLDISRTSDVESADGQYTATMTIAPGETRGIRIAAASTRPGLYHVTGVVEYRAVGAAADANEPIRRTARVLVLSEGVNRDVSLLGSIERVLVPDFGVDPVFYGVLGWLAIVFLAWLFFWGRRDPIADGFRILVSALFGFLLLFILTIWEFYTPFFLVMMGITAVVVIQRGRRYWRRV